LTKWFHDARSGGRKDDARGLEKNKTKRKLGSIKTNRAVGSDARVQKQPS